MSLHVAVRDAPFSRGVNIYFSVRGSAPGDRDFALSFDIRHVEIAEAGREPDANPLVLDSEAARALYEALADHFGHSGHDIRALRKDYDAERARVDKFIQAVLK